MISRIAILPALLWLAVANSTEAAQSTVDRYPRKPVRIVVPFAS